MAGRGDLMPKKQTRTEEAADGDLMPEENTRTEEAAGPWADLLPTDVLHSVALLLPPPDLSSFQKVCKTWRSLPMESYPFGRSPVFITRHSELQCQEDFVFFSRKQSQEDFVEGDNLYFYSPFYNMLFSWATSHEVLDMFRLPIMYSKDGWIAFYNGYVVFVNPFLPSANAIIKWRTPKNYFFWNRSTPVSMSAPPTDPTCILLLIHQRQYAIHMIIGSEGGTNWKVRRIREGSGEYMFNPNPVFHGGAFYCLMTAPLQSPGALGIYDPHRRTWDQYDLGIPISWRVLLVESDGELLIPVVSRQLSNHRLLDNSLGYKFNESSKKLEKLTDLRGRALFYSTYLAISAAAEVGGMKDRIFWHKFHCTALKVGSKLHRSAGGGPRIVPIPHVRLSELATRAEKSIVASFRYPLDAAQRRMVEEFDDGSWAYAPGVWVQPN